MNQIASFTETVPKGEDETEIILHIVLKEGVSFRDPGVDYFNGFHRQHKIPGHLKQPQDLYWKLEHPPAT